jgi:AraC-like DNA-binding protein
VPSGASISMLLVRPLVQALKPSARDAFFRATDLTAPMIADADARVSAAQFCVAWSEALRLSGDPTLALRIAEGAQPGLFGVVEYLCYSAPTLLQALRQWVRYLGILDDAVEVALVDLGSNMSLRVTRESEAPAPASHELCFALIVHHARRLFAGRFRVASVGFTHPGRKGEALRYRAALGAPVTFGAAHTELVLPHDVLAAPLPTADPNLLAVLLPTADEKRARRSPDPSLTDQVRRALRTALSSDDAQLEVVAQKLGLTPRSLQRRLKDEGQSFALLRETTRRELADRYLAEGLSAAEISFLLGFSEPSVFFRAFKRWTGVTPFERRAQQRTSQQAS